MKDYSDAFIRYIRATELITFQKRTFRLIISPQKIEEVYFLLENTPREALSFSSKKEFGKYLFNPFTLNLLSDDKLLLLEKIKKLGLTDTDTSLDVENLKDILDELHLSIKTRNIEEKKKELNNRIYLLTLYYKAFTGYNVSKCAAISS